MSEKSLVVTAPNWPSKFADRVKYMGESPIRALMKFLGDPTIISFAGGLPSPNTFPKWEILVAFMQILSDPKRVISALQYGPTEGYRPLREQLAEKVGRYGVPATADNILLTCGSQQALYLIGKIFIDENTIVCTERPTYLGAVQAYDSHGAKYCTVPMDENGMIVDQLPKVIETYHPKFIYAIPNFHNPGGVCMSLERRIKLVEIAEKYDLFIVEDDPYGDLRFEGEHITPIISLAKERTINLGTFSKTLSPGLRTGWVVAPEKLIPELAKAKQGADLFSSLLLQMAVSAILESGILPEHVKKSRALYSERRDAMLSTLDKYMPKEVTWTHPEGGLFLWLTVPEKINVREFFETARKEGVAFIPGYGFYPREVSPEGELLPERPEANATMRLNFSAETPERIKEGIEKLAGLIVVELAK